MVTSKIGGNEATATSPAQEFTSRNLTSMEDLSPAETESVLDLAALMKAKPADFSSSLAGKQLVLFFEKPSLRTRLTFESGICSLGGVSFFVDQTASRLGERESISDMAHNLERWVDGIVLRTFEHSTVVDFAKHAAIPVINALSDYEHPCQALADYLTLKEHCGNLKQAKLAYVGDGNNVAHSLLLAAASLGSHIAVACPKGYEPNQNVVAKAQQIAAATGAVVKITTNAIEAVKGADAVYTGVWASMGNEQQAAERRATFASYQVNQKLFSHAAPHAIFMHCLPAHRGEEVTSAVIDSPRSVVFDEAENRLHVQKAILLILMGGALRRFAPRSAHA